jgi:hypothetical protein
MAVTFDISRDFLDGLSLQQPASREGARQVQVNGQLQFLPSSPDGTLHTAVVRFAIGFEGSEAPFARAGWRFLFSTDQAFDPSKDAQNRFFQELLTIGIGKILVQLNNLCMHANLPLVPLDPQRIAQAAQPMPPPGDQAAAAAAKSG